MPKGFPKNGVNKGWIKNGSVGLRKNAIVSKETREKMRLAKLGTTRIFSEQHRKHLSEALIGGSRPSLKGKKRVFTEEWKRNIGLAKLGKPGKNKGKTWKINPAYIPDMSARVSGSKNPAYLQDRSKLKKYTDSALERNSPFYKDWRRQICNRDNWKCKIGDSDCSGRLEVHHILSYSNHPKLRYDINNGITLCHFHHPRKRADEARLSPYFMELILQT